MSVIVYSKPNCIQCVATKRVLDAQGTDYKNIDLSADKNALETVIQLGYREAPVVVVEDKHWSGFRPDLIKQLCAN
ncbi:glutaredoxin-like protein NrdH [Photobacterium phosphoreum]|jgi:glutaredoxin-like protein NrdH|uniref:glutaredoxin-like protein NrdH n=1 Tax=Photobacterium phosphoreum TaxID=659 RepID=UPI0007F96DF9|nr:glutaredoxin-like protein NrdH [Photobacterium phosphoreum]MCD9471036.1 NrdH-redoxin [Photobacterium phosphoreum]MCD9501316.1 glutaredoxin-like protein NrdH [Photobacterium phosphoreum]MCD9507414.1 glutaredoxin-like protein NrdH [Photobacterium phosphoreum]OBU41173.1 NrdH-redoxin [Photobacterium phosphoreum]PTB32019.1 glutaredoxin-like protein NrdH [Photobacterium phosphoreum]